MGKKDLGTCIILSEKDSQRLDIDLTKLEYICDHSTPIISGFSYRRMKRKLRNTIERYAKKQNADIAVITSQSDGINAFTTDIRYSYSLYRYCS